MHLKADTSTYFIPGNLVLTSDEAGRNFKDISALKGIEGGRFIHNDLATNYYVSRASGRERMIIVGFSGANAQFPINPKEIKYLNDHGATLICMALPRVGPDFMKRAETLTRAFLTSQRSPANFLVCSDAPQFLMTHSSSGPIITALLGEPVSGKGIRSRFDGLGMLSPIWDVPYASRDHSFGINSRQIGPLAIPPLRTNAVEFGPVTIPALRTKPMTIGPVTIPSFGTKAFTIGPVTIPSFGTNAIETGAAILPAFRPLSKIFEWYADWNANKSFSDLRIVRQYIKITSRKEAAEEEPEEKYFERKTLRNMTMGHIRQIQTYARGVIDNYDPKHTAGIDIVMMTGDADNCTCWKTNAAMARKIGAEFHLVAGGGHDILKKKPELLDVFLAKAEEHISLRDRLKAASAYYADKPYGAPPEETIPLPPLPLRHRLGDGARAALQRGAGALNATASFF